MSISTKELSRLEVLQRLSAKQMNQKEAGEILHLGTRQIKRLLKGYRKQGVTGLISKHRGCKASNRIRESAKKEVLNLLKTKYQGFGPTLAHDAIITVYADAKQNITLLYNDKSLLYNVFYKQTKQLEVVLAKDLNRIILPKPYKPTPDHPWRTFLFWKSGDILTLG